MFVAVGKEKIGMGNVTNSAVPSAAAKIKKYFPLLIIVMLFASFFAFGFDKYLSFTVFSENRDKLISFVDDHYITGLMLYCVLYTVAVAASLPGGLLLTICGGFLFGWGVGGLITVFSATIGATLLFLIAATSIGDVLKQKAGPWLARLEKGFQDNAMSYLLFLRLVPAFPFWLVNIAPAFLGVSLRTYVIGTFLGIIPGTFVFSFIGSGVDSVIVEQQERYAACMQSGAEVCTKEFNVGSLITIEIVLSLVALGVISLLPILLKKWGKA